MTAHQPIDDIDVFQAFIDRHCVFFRQDGFGDDLLVLMVSTSCEIIV